METEEKNTDQKVDGKEQETVVTHKAETKETKEFTPITSQEEFDEKLRTRLERAKRSAIADARAEIEAELRADIEAEAERKANEEKGEFKKLYEEAQKTIAKLEKDLEDTKVETLKVTLLEKHKLPASAAKRIFGTTEEEIESDIKTYLKELGPITAPKEPGVTSQGTKSVDSKVKTSSGQDVNDPTTWGLPPLKS